MELLPQDVGLNCNALLLADFSLHTEDFLPTFPCRYHIHKHIKAFASFIYSLSKHKMCMLNHPKMDD